MNIAIVGFATEGQVSADYFARRGHSITVCDQNEALEVPAQYKTQLGEQYLHDLDRFDMVVRSAGIAPHILLGQNPGIAPKITTAVNEFLAHCPTANVIGITGTKGKGTTSTLTTKMLGAAGHTVWLGGNIGRSPLEFIDDIAPDDWVVLELSSFQLIDLTHSPRIAVCLMVVPEHLNWHADMAEYVAAKSQLFMQQSSEDVAIYFAGNETSKRIASHGAGQKVPYFTEPGAWMNGNMLTIDGQSVCATDAIKLLGKHNQQNICAALTAVWQAGMHDIAAAKQVISSFSGLEHRLEFVRELDGVRYYNDSFASTPDAGTAAIAAIPGKKVMIMGGYERNLPLKRFAKSIKDQQDELCHLLLIGESAERVGQELEAINFKNYTISTAKNIKDIVKSAQEIATKGAEAVVLSPGFASFDMFKNFEERGQLYKQAVIEL